jgi:hypothetical protein
LTFRSRLALAGACAIALHPVCALAATLPAQTASYSATTIFEIDKDHYNSTVIADHGRERRMVETPYGTQTVVINPAEGKAYLLQAPLGALALDLKSRAAGVNLAQLYGADAQPVGHETLDGQSVTKYRLNAKPAQDASFSGYVWATSDGIFVKVDGTGIYRDKTSHVAMRLTGIQRGTQDPSSFALPPGMHVIDASSLVKQLLQPGEHSGEH